jgi:hypothetical protein
MVLQIVAQTYINFKYQKEEVNARLPERISNRSQDLREDRG